MTYTMYFWTPHTHLVGTRQADTNYSASETLCAKAEVETLEEREKPPSEGLELTSRRAAEHPCALRGERTRPLGRASSRVVSADSMRIPPSRRKVRMAGSPPAPQIASDHALRRLSELRAPGRSSPKRARRVAPSRAALKGRRALPAERTRSLVLTSATMGGHSV
jgi:hypothetical protein